MVQTQDLRSTIQIRRQSEEEYLLGQAKHRSDIEANDQSDFQEALMMGTCAINVQERWEPKNI